MDVIIEIIFEEDIDITNDEIYEDLLTYCEWFFFDGDVSIIKNIPNDYCEYFRIICNHYIEPAYMLRLQSSHTDQ